MSSTTRLNPPGWAKGLFKKIAEGAAPSKKIYEDKHVVAFLDISPLSKGHALVIPRKEVTFLDEMDEDTSAAIGKVLPRIGRAIMSATGAKHYNVLQNNGSLAHQVVPHVHFHVIPKFTSKDGLVLQWNTQTLGDDADELAVKIRALIKKDRGNAVAKDTKKTIDLIYFPIAGRGELTRLIAAAGGVTLNESFSKDWKQKSLDMGFFGSLPILQQGTFKLSQSSAMERYVASMCPKFAFRDSRMNAMEDMIAATKEDIVTVCAKVVFGDEKVKADAKTSIPAALDRYLSPIEAMLPASGFFLGRPYPTIADLALVNIVECTTPVGIAVAAAGGYDFSKYPKIMAVVTAAKQSEGVRQYLASSKTMKARF